MSTSNPLTIALDQGPIEAHTPERALRRLAGIAGRAAASGARLLVTPEMSITGYNIGERIQQWAEPADGPIARRVASIAAETGVAIVHGFPERAGADVHNTAALTSPTGERTCYRKAHLFGEMERAHFRPGGDPVRQTTVDGLRVGLLICYDVEFPEAVRAHALAGTELLLVPTALMAPEGVVADELVPVRAFENQIHLAYVNRCGREGELDYVGKSCLIGPDGTELARAGSGEELLIAEVDPAATAFARHRYPQLADRRPALYTALTSPEENR